MGNCQAVDTASLVIQHPCGKADKLYWPVNASEIIKTNPGHYVALLISTTLCPTDDKTSPNKPVRVTRIKLLRPTDTLVLGQVYRLITAKDVMKGLGAKKQARMKKALSETIETSTITTTSTRSEMDKENHHHQHQVTRHERQQQRSTPSTNSSAKARTWQPSLHSISEAANLS